MKGPRGEGKLRQRWGTVSARWQDDEGRSSGLSEVRERQRYDDGVVTCQGRECSR